MNESDKLGEGLRRIRGAPLADLASVPFVERVISEIGLFHDHRMLYGEPGNEFMNPGAGLWQVPRQLAEFLVSLRGEAIRSYLEVGTFQGYTTHVVDAYLGRFNPGLRTVGIDPGEHYDRRVPRSWDYRRCTTASLRGRAFDLVLVDGDHRYESVRADWENVGRHARICAFHDVNDRYVEEELEGGVVKFWNELVAGPGLFRSYLHHPQGDRIMGIGVATTP